MSHASNGKGLCAAPGGRATGLTLGSSGLGGIPSSLRGLGSLQSLSLFTTSSPGPSLPASGS